MDIGGMASGAATWQSLREEAMRPWRERWIARHPAGIGEKSWDAIFAGGKEIRPALFCELWQHLVPGQAPDGELAFAIECIHAASLILDDTPLMDNAAERRGRPAIHAAYTTYKAIYFAFEIAEIVFDIWIKKAPADEAAAADWWNFLRDKVLQLCAGQYYDLLGGTDLHTLAVLKTGALFELATEMVALRAGLSRQAWRTWGRQIGVLFQWADDWADRDDDRAAGSRNAFLENPDLIIGHYYALLDKSNIGTGWRARPFGDWLMRYYEEHGPTKPVTATAVVLPHVFIADQPAAEFLKTVSPVGCMNAVAKRFMLFYTPTSRVMAFFNKYKPTIPNALKRVADAGMENVLRLAISYKDELMAKGRSIWSFESEEDWEVAAIAELAARIEARGGDVVKITEEEISWT